MSLRVPISWLKEYVNVTSTSENLAERLTLAGLEVESVEKVGEGWKDKQVIIGKIIDVHPHPQANRLSLVKVEYGQEKTVTVITGAPNIRCLEKGLPADSVNVVLARPGALVFDPKIKEQNRIKLQPTTIRGINSEGMLCSEKELGLSDNHEGVFILPSDAPVGVSLWEYLGESVLHFDIKGSFSHLLGIFGIARETAALYKIPLKRDVQEVLGKHSNTITVDPSFVGLAIEDNDLCSRYSVFLIKNVKVGTSPFWMQQRIQNAGMRPINNVVDITNYVMLELGQPLHAFDYTLLKKRAEDNKPWIIVRRAKENETLVTLDGENRKLDQEMLLITDTQGPIALAGVMGGAETEVSEDTVDILLESANFEFLNNRRTSQILKLRTEASERYGQHLDPELTMIAGARAAYLMEEITGGSVEKIIGDLYVNPLKEKTITLDPKYVRHLLGMQIPNTEMTKILRSLEFKVTGEDLLEVKVPSHRMDVNLPADLTEEIVRIYGYDHLVPTSMKDELPPQRQNKFLTVCEKVRNILTGIGLDEIISYSLINPEEEAILYPEEELDISKYISLKNPQSQERSHLRRSLLCNALKTARSNLKQTDRVCVFEIGKVFYPKKGELLPDEKTNLCLLMTGFRNTPSWLTGRQGEFMDFFDIKGVIETLFQSLNLPAVIWKRSQAFPYHPGHCAEIIMQGKSMGHIGEIHPKICNNLELPKQPFCAAEIAFDRVFKHINDKHSLVQLSHFSPIFEDLSFVVNESITADMVQSLILRTGRPLLQKIELFDVYRGEKIGKGKKSLAFALTYQSLDRTLTDLDVEPIREKIIQRLKIELNALLRDKL